MSSNSSETNSDETQVSEEPLELESNAQGAGTLISLVAYELGRSLFSIPFHPFLHHALQRKGVDIATRTQLAFFAHSQEFSNLLFPLNRGGGRFVAMCLSILNRALRGERFLVVCSNPVLRKYIATDLESLGAFCPLDVSVFHHVHEKISTVINTHHIVVSPFEGLQDALKDVTTSMTELVVIEPEMLSPESVLALKEMLQISRFLGLYQKEKAIVPAWKELISDVQFVSYETRVRHKNLFCIPRAELVVQIQQIVLYVDTPMLLVCSSEEEARMLYMDLAKEFSLVAYLPQTSLRRNKEQAYRLLSSKKIQLIVLAQEEYSKNSNFPIICLGDEPMNTDVDCYWICSECKEENQDNLLLLPSLDVLRQKSQQKIIHELQKSMLSPVAQDIDALYEAIKDDPYLLKAALKDSVQYQTHSLYEQLQEALRIEEKEAFARKKTWKPNPKKRKKRR